MKKIILCDSLMHPTPILKGWCLGLLDLGYNATFLPLPQYSILDINEEVDILVYPFITEEHIPQFEIFKKKYPNTKIIGCRDEWDPSYSKLKGIVDFFVVALEDTPSLKKEYKKNGFDLYNIPLAGNDKLFYKDNHKKKFDACWIGHLSHGYRSEDKFLYPILDKYDCFLGGMTYKNYQHGFIPYQNHNLIRNQTKININFHVPYQKPNRGKFYDRVDCNQSVFNIALSGNFQLCDHPLVTDYFKGNVVLGDENNWLELFEYYLNNKKERDELAHNAMVIAQKEHTWKKRMEQFINILKLHYEG